MTQSVWGEYSKGLQDPELRAKFFDALDAKDVFEASGAANAAGNGRRQVDFALCAAKPLDRLLISRSPLKPPTAEEFERDLAVLRELSELRSVPLADLEPDDIPSATEKEFEALTVVSWFLKDTLVRSYVGSYEPDEIVRGGHVPPSGPELAEEATPITTGYHAATYVHKDNPMQQWMDVLIILLRLGVPHKRAHASGSKQGDFAYCGFPYWVGVYGDLLRRAGMLSFTQKWLHRAARPEAHGIWQVFPEGSPMHPSFPAMHGYAAHALAALTKNIFDENFVLPSGRTVGDEVELLAHNIAQWRSWAGVHYPSDNVCSIDQATKLADTIVSNLRKE